ncbi:hypothetical protein R1flu_009018 [Riccia fluitans]|uniref:Uncharacterized protein n=1 Tax=Riccia fluitans TaxID=41844 RepID=A0ABD1Z1D2_9MARC
MVEIKLLPTSSQGKVRKVDSRKQKPVVRHRYPGKIEMSLKQFSMIDLEEISFGLKDSKITTLRLFCSGPDCGCALGTGGWLKHLELGFKPWRRDLRVLSHAIGCSTTLKKLSMANSRIGDSGLQILAQGLSSCPPLQILDLSGCALSDESHASVGSILKASVGLNAQAEWQSSLRRSQSGKVRNNIPGLALHWGLVALDLSFNLLSDTSAEYICGVLRLGAPLAGIDIRV